MKNKYIKILYWLLAVFPFVISIIFYNSLPDQVPIHWDAAGQINGYASRPVAAFGIPALLLICTVLVNFQMYADPQKQNIDRSPQLRFIGRWIIVILANVMQFLTVTNAFQTLNRVKLIFIVIGILFIAIGNYLPKCKYNYTVGIKLPWTLASEENWQKTHRLAGFTWVLGGILIVGNAFFASQWLFIAAMVLMIGIPAVYSYLIFVKEKKHPEK